MNRNLSAIVITCGLFLIELTASSQFLDHGSLVIVVPSKKGLVVVSEKRVIHLETNSEFEPIISKRKLSDTAIKIEQLNNYFGFSVTGIRIWGNNNIENFNAMKIVKDYFLNKASIDLDSDMLELSQILGVKMRTNVASYLMTKTKPEIVTTVLIYGYNVDKGKFQVGLINLFLSIEGDQSILRPTVFLRKEFNTSLITRAGFENIIEKFEAEKNKILIKSTKELYSKEEAIQLAKFLIFETSKSTDGVGETVDIALINKIGFRWLKK
jgi:hypothetical protein